jgi:hypothetical protein
VAAGDQGTLGSWASLHKVGGYPRLWLRPPASDMEAGMVADIDADAAGAADAACRYVTV